VRILCVATKAPWPPNDGGRLALWLTLQGLADAGHKIALVVPDASGADASSYEYTELRAVCTLHFVPVRSRSYAIHAINSLLTWTPFSIVKHASNEVANAVTERARQFQPDVIHAEQLQAVANCAGVAASGVPLLLRMQNVESELWNQLSRSGGWRRLMALEGRRLKRHETMVLRNSDQTSTLTGRDAFTLRDMVPREIKARIACIAPEFPSELPTAAMVTGQPAVALSGSSGWWPNAQGSRWFFDTVWPAVHAAFPAADAHVYGGALVRAANVHCHPAPVDSIEAFPQNAIVVVPIQVGSGIRMRILEAWARGLPVIATTVAARGLDVESYRQLIIADSANDYVSALRKLSLDGSLRERLVTNGREYLRRHHNRTDATRALLDGYARAASAATMRTSRDAA